MVYEEPQQLVTPSNQKKKQIDNAPTTDPPSAEPPTAPEATTVRVNEEAEGDTSITPADDGLPHPRVCVLYPLERVEKFC